MPDSYSISVDNSHLTILQNNSLCLWEVSISDLNQTITAIDENTSAVIVRLNEKSWTTVGLLYEVATIIERYHPINNINWFATFTFVELCDSLEKSFELKQKIENKDDSDMTNIFDYLGFAHRNSQEESEQIAEIVREKLRQYKLHLHLK